MMVRMGISVLVESLLQNPAFYSAHDGRSNDWRKNRQDCASSRLHPASVTSSKPAVENPATWWSMNPNPKNPAENYQPGAGPAANTEKKRDPENRPAGNEEDVREKTLDKTLADSFPTSDPPSSIPDPSEDDDAA
jgi:hypothetical protein